MIVVMNQGATNAQIVNVTARIEQWGCRVHISAGEEHTIIGVIGNGRPLDRGYIELMDGVERTVPVLRPFKLASRDFHPQDTVVPVNGVTIGGQQLVVMAGPCSVESHDQLREAACCAVGPSSRAALPTASKGVGRERTATSGRSA